MKGFRSVVVTLTTLFGGGALAFCGFYVAKADGELFNQASQIIYAKDGNRNKITMVSDFKGNVKDFAMVVPVPVVLKESEISVLEPDLIKKLDAYSAPRLVEYFDRDPCAPIGELNSPQSVTTMPSTQVARAEAPKVADALGVTVEATYEIGEYTILILSATESSGLETWLVQNGYKLPKGASAALAPYIKMNMKFFVAKVNLEKYNSSGFTTLRPIQMSFESKDFMLPLRLGMLNAKGNQDVIVYALTRKGRVETANYRTTVTPSNIEIPEYIEKQFGTFYKALFSKAHAREGSKTAFIEYAWNPSWCDPCAAPPPSLEDLERAGAGWVRQSNQIFFTRLHVRYNKLTHKDDLMLRETSNQSTHQGRYVLQRPFKGDLSCEAGKQYKTELSQRLEKQAQTLANLTGWKIEDIRKRMGI
ncbi:MAG: hypothetical protein RLZZ156_2664 [Deinococcota bacterium]|jgi:hypothetical protein